MTRLSELPLLQRAQSSKERGLVSVFGTITLPINAGSLRGHCAL